MSKGIFAQLRTPTAKNPHPVLLTPQVSVISSQQLRDYAFCSNCEQRFNRNGESWVLANMVRMNGFKLQDALIEAGPVVVHPTIALYAGAAIPSIDMDALVYFAMSILWRAAVQEWKSIDGLTTRLDLDGHEEEIREFLLGGPFPADAVVMVSVGRTGRCCQQRIPRARDIRTASRRSTSWSLASNSASCSAPAFPAIYVSSAPKQVRSGTSQRPQCWLTR
jgi:hypothetical protein